MLLMQERSVLSGKISCFLASALLVISIPSVSFSKISCQKSLEQIPVFGGISILSPPSHLLLALKNKKINFTDFGKYNIEYNDVGNFTEKTPPPLNSIDPFDINSIHGYYYKNYGFDTEAMTVDGDEVKYISPARKEITALYKVVHTNISGYKYKVKYLYELNNEIIDTLFKCNYKAYNFDKIVKRQKEFYFPIVLKKVRLSYSDYRNDAHDFIRSLIKVFKNKYSFLKEETKFGVTSDLYNDTIRIVFHFDNNKKYNGNFYYSYSGQLPEECRCETEIKINPNSF